MKTENPNSPEGMVYHKFGGKVESVTAITHFTHKGKSTWEFVGRLVWNDGTVSENAHILPVYIVHDGTDKSRAAVNSLFDCLAEYLKRHGKYDKKGIWKPHEANGREEIKP